MSELTWVEIIYWGSTIIGGTLFILRTTMLLAGGGFDDDVLDANFDSDISGGMDTPDDIDLDAEHTDTDASFKLLSLQSITAFFLMFGLVGLTLLKTGLHVLFTFVGGFLAGSFTVWLLGVLVAQMSRLQSDGTISITNTIGEKGAVYLTIPAKGSGQVQITVQGSLKIFDAISKEKNKLATGTKIQVIDVVDNSTLIVEKTQ